MGNASKESSFPPNRSSVAPFAELQNLAFSLQIHAEMFILLFLEFRQNCDRDIFQLHRIQAPRGKIMNADK